MRLSGPTRCTRSMFSASIFLLACSLAAPVPGFAQPVLAGLDLWETRPGGSTFDNHFTQMPIPAGFFGPGSDPFFGTIVFQGTPLPPLGGAPTAPADTIVRRLQNASLETVPSQDTVPIEIVALNLRSVNPITVTFNGGQNPQQWNVNVCLSDQPQPQGAMTIRRECPEGGTFTSFLPVRAKFILSNGPTTRIFDPNIVLQFSTSQGHWVNQADPAFQIVQVPPGQPVIVDSNCDGLMEPPLLEGTTNFSAGVRALPCICSSGPPLPSPTQMKRMTQEDEMLAKHGVLPAQHCPSGDNDGDLVCNDADNCPNNANPRQEDGDDDGRGDLCDNCPTVANTDQADANGNGIGDLCELSPVICRRGNVNAAAGAASITNVLFINGSPGVGNFRTLNITPTTPFSVRVDAPPSNPLGPAPLVMCVWRGAPAAGTPRLLAGIGVIGMPIPGTGGAPQPVRTANSIGNPIMFGPENWPPGQSPTQPAPTLLLNVPRGIRRTGTFYFQGFLIDCGAPNRSLGVTNGIEVRST